MSRIDSISIELTGFNVKIEKLGKFDIMKQIILITK